MLPLELKGKVIKLPETDSHTIVIITGKSLRHKRFSYRIQKEFGKSVVAWYELDSDYEVKYAKTTGNQDRGSSFSDSKSKKFLRLSKEIIPCIFKGGLVKTVSRSLSSFRYKREKRSDDLGDMRAQKELFEKEVEGLKAFAVVEPEKINPADVHTSFFIDQIKGLDPYFFLTLGGPIYKMPLLEVIRGIGINQHAGHSPVLRGANTIKWALYNRSLNYVSSTIHMLTCDVDGGPILRRSNPCIFPHDSVGKIKARVVALGTELMIEVVKDIINNKNVRIFEQPKTIGKTYLSEEYTRHIRSSIARDFEAGWLTKELERLRGSY